VNSSGRHGKATARILLVLFCSTRYAYPQADSSAIRGIADIPGHSAVRTLSAISSVHTSASSDTAGISLPQVLDLNFRGGTRSNADSEIKTQANDTLRISDSLRAITVRRDSIAERRAVEAGPIIPRAAYDSTSFSFKDADIRDIFRALGLEHGLNIFVDNSVNNRVTISLTRVPVHEANKISLRAEQADTCCGGRNLQNIARSSSSRGQGSAEASGRNL